MTNVLFIHPAIRTMEPPGHAPYGILGLAAIVDQLGFKVGIIDNNAFRLPIDALRQEIKGDKWDIVGISSLVTQYKFVKELVPVIREEQPQALLIGGGGLFSSLPFETMRWLDLDISVIGEAYKTLPEIIEHVDDKDWKHVKGLVYREGKKIKLSGMRPLIEEYYYCPSHESKHYTFEEAMNHNYECPQCHEPLLNNLDEEIPFPAYEYSPVETYLMNSRIPYSVASMQPNCVRLDALTSYGCNFNCNFCFHPSSPTCLGEMYGKQTMGKPFRQHSPNYVIRLLTHLRLTYCINFASFIDENLTVNRKWFEEFCNELESSGLATLINWGAVCHTRTVDAAMLKRAKDVGCAYLSFGGETTSENLLKNIGKGQKKEQITAAIDACRAAGINAIVSFIIGFSETTIDDLIGDAQFFEDYQVYVDPFFCFPNDTPVIGNPSINNIEDIKIGDKVRTHTGAYKTVNARFERNYNGELVCIKAYDLPSKTTPDHPVLTIQRPALMKDKRDGHLYPRESIYESSKKEPKWLPASQLAKGDLLIMPIDRKVTDVSYAKLPLKFRGGHKEIEQIPCDMDLLRLSGYYLAEGSLAYRRGHHGEVGDKILAGIQLAFGAHEINLHKDVITISKKLLEYTPRVYNPKATATMICIFNRPFTRWIKQEFGEGAHKKSIPDWVMHLPLTKQSELIKGYWRGDGSIEKLGFSFSSCNIGLLRQIKQMLLRFNIISSIKQTHMHMHKHYALSVQGASLQKMSELLGISHPWLLHRTNEVKRNVIIDDRAFIPIKRIWREPYSGAVYNLGVENNESYVVANLGAVHNCQPYPSTKLYKEYKDKIIEQHLSENEKDFLKNPALELYNKIFTISTSEETAPSQSQLVKNLPILREKIRDKALERWVLSLDDATRMSVNLTKFTDVELAGLRYMLHTWNVKRLKEFKKQKEEKS